MEHTFGILTEYILEMWTLLSYDTPSVRLGVLNLKRRKIESWVVAKKVVVRCVLLKSPNQTLFEYNSALKNLL